MSIELKFDRNNKKIDLSKFAATIESKKYHFKITFSLTSLHRYCPNSVLTLSNQSNVLLN